jgi:hypothetical protein
MTDHALDRKGMGGTAWDGLRPDVGRFASEEEAVNVDVLCTQAKYHPLIDG